MRSKSTFLLAVLLCLGASPPATDDPRARERGRAGERPRCPRARRVPGGRPARGACHSDSGLRDRGPLRGGPARAPGAEAGRRRDELPAAGAAPRKPAHVRLGRDRGAGGAHGARAAPGLPDGGGRLAGRDERRGAGGLRRLRRDGAPPGTGRLRRARREGKNRGRARERAGETAERGARLSRLAHAQGGARGRARRRRPRDAAHARRGDAHPVGARCGLR
jgi:hypothetical protein